MKTFDLSKLDTKTETAIDAITRIAERFAILEEMTTATKNGPVRGIIVVGPPGLGKSFGIQNRLEYDNLPATICNVTDYEIVKGAITGIGLYKKLHDFKEPGQVLVFDDCDTVLHDELMLNLLKAAIDSGPRRQIHWNAESRVLKYESIPNKFDFNGSVIFVTNVNFDNVRSKKLQNHLSALQSRCHYIDLTLNTQRDCFLRIVQVARDCDLFSRYSLTDDQKGEILDFMWTNINRLREVSLRMALKIADLRTVTPNSWERYAEVTLMK